MHGNDLHAYKASTICTCYNGGGGGGGGKVAAVAEHAMEEMHVINWEEAQVVDSHPHYTQRCTLEAWHIRSERNNLNRDVGPLPSTYNPLIYSST